MVLIHGKLLSQFIYQPGSTNVVADALSRIQINNLTDSNESVSDQNTQQRVVLRMLYKKPANFIPV